MVAHPRMCTSGALGKYACSDPTTALGREYLHLQLSTIIADDSKIQDLAITGKYKQSYFLFDKERVHNRR